MKVRSADSRNQDERGAVAIMFALLVVVLCGLSAVAVDLGNAYQRKGETQSQADLAALSAAPALATSHDAAVLKVVAYLKNNTKVGQDLSSLSSAMLTDGNPANGEVTFPSKYSMKVRTPDAAVDYAFAGVIGFDGDGEVSATATVGVGTPGGSAVMPYYAVTGAGCDYGTQSLTDPANGQAQSVVPTLAAPTTTPTQTSNASLTGATPYQFDLGTTGSITLNGARLSVRRADRLLPDTRPRPPNVFEETSHGQHQQQCGDRGAGADERDELPGCLVGARLQDQRQHRLVAGRRGHPDPDRGRSDPVRQPVELGQLRHSQAGPVHVPVDVGA